MSQLSNPRPNEIIDDPTERLRQLSYRKERLTVAFVMTGEDAFFLKKFAKDRNFTPEALALHYVLEGLWRERTIKEL